MRERKGGGREREEGQRRVEGGRDRIVMNLLSFPYRISLLLLLAVITGILCTLRVSRDKLEISTRFDRYTCTLDTETRGCIAA